MTESTKIPNTMRIGQLVKATGKTARTLHFYEEMGLLRPASRTKGGFRLYDDTALVRVRWIERLQELGFSLQEVQDFLTRLSEEAYGPDAMKHLRSFYVEKLEETRLAMARMRALERDLRNSIDYLDGCRSCEPLTNRSDFSICDQHPGQDQVVPDLVAAVTQAEA